MKKSERSTFWQNHITKWECSQLTQTDYCRQQQIDPGLFSKWKIRLKNKDSNTEDATHNSKVDQLVELPIITSPGQCLYEIVLRNGICIKVNNSFNMNQLKELIHAAGVV